MLPLFRSKKEWLKWTLLLVIFALGFTTVLLFVRTPTGITSGVGVREVARVAGEPISVIEFQRYYRQLMDVYRQIYNLDQRGPEMLKQLGIGQQALNQLINQYAGLYEADKLGLLVSKRELIEQIQMMPVFQENGHFVGMARYRQVLQANNLSPQSFEDSLRRDILNQKLRNILTDGIVATADEVRQKFLDDNQSVKVRYVLFDPEKLDLGEFTDEELKKYYDENQDEFREPEKRKLKYVSVFIKPTDVQVSEEEVEEALAEVPKQEQVHARHILIRVEDDEAAARKKAEDLLQQIRNGADFAKLAQENSDDRASASKGGDLGFFSKGQMVPEFEQAAFSLQEGQVSDLVRSQFGFHIIQTLEKSTSDRESMRPAAEFNARSAKADKQSSELAEVLAADVKAGASLEEAAEKHGQELKETSFFDRASGIPSLPADQGFLDKVFGMSEGEVTGPHANSGQYIIAQLVEIQPARIPEFEEVRTRVTELYKEERGRTVAREAAEKFIDEVKKPEDFGKVAKEHGLEVTTTDFFKRNSTIDDNLKFSPDVHDQAFGLDIGDLSTPIAVAGKHVVFQLAEKSAVDEEKFAKEKSEIEETLTQQKRSQFYSAYLANVVSELRRNDEIAINQQLLDDLTS